MSFEAVVLAGGRGTRLSPYTYVLPKPLLPINERPIIDIVLSQLAASGCTRVVVTVGHLGHMIELYCAELGRWGLEIEFLREDQPLGTVGALGSMRERFSSPFVVANGDVLTDLRVETLFETHATSGAELTIGAFRRTERDEYGLLEVDAEGRLTAYREKPEHEFVVSMGVYVLSPSVLDLVDPGVRLDFPDLVHRLLAADRVVTTHVHDGYWLDLGRPDDFARANEEFPALRERIVP